MITFSALIVEDTPDFQDIYSRAVRRLEGEVVVASSYEEAIHAIQRRSFAVAIVDVRLSEEDETNVDGLRVLEFVRKIGDRTKAILITGHGTFQIAREAFRRYDVFEGLEKGVPLAEIEAAIGRARQTFTKDSSKEKISYSPLLKPPTGPLWEWEDRAIRACSPKGGADGLYRFFDAFLRDLTPLIPHATAHGCLINDVKKLVAGLFWSRPLGQAVLIAFGHKSEVSKLENKPRPSELSELFFNVDLPILAGTIKRTDSYGVYGVIITLGQQDFSAFESGKLGK